MLLNNRCREISGSKNGKLQATTFKLLTSFKSAFKNVFVRPAGLHGCDFYCLLAMRTTFVWSKSLQRNAQFSWIIEKPMALSTHKTQFEIADILPTCCKNISSACLQVRILRSHKKQKSHPIIILKNNETVRWKGLQLQYLKQTLTWDTACK